ncbi:MAG: OmpA family protein [Bacteroidetes bacterium]|nr:MAG: OmpA family protein [Bacteroidota bacterium]
MKLLAILIVFFFSFSKIAFAQLETSIWYFGEKAGIIFKNNVPSELTNSVLATEEGCATMSNEKGKLLFYTDGITVWNTKHLPMPNGVGLKGDPSSTQSGVIIQKPKNKNIYYVFTVTKEGRADGFQYSSVDMTLDNGLGDVREKNVMLKTPVTEKITAVKHRNGVDMWVIVHEWKSDAFWSFLVTAQGVTKEGVESKVGSVHKGSFFNTQGYMKTSPDGTNIALIQEESCTIEVLDFDDETGKVSNPFVIPLKRGSFPYGVEFSPSGSLLYATAAQFGEVYQFNLHAGSVKDIIASKVVVGNSPNKEWIGALQVALDGKIYFPIYGTSFLGAINKPNELGKQCGFKAHVVLLADRIARLGLPTFTQSYFTQAIVEKQLSYFSNKAELNKILVLQNLSFETGKAEIRAISHTELNKVYEILKADPAIKIEVTGHTDNIGNKTTNFTLSSERAEAVAAYFVAKGLDPARISSKGMGSSRPVRNNVNEQSRQMNRRVELLLRKE